MFELHTEKNKHTEMSEYTERKVVGYYTNWSQYRTATVGGWPSKFTPERIDAKLFDVLNFAFVTFDDTYEVKEYEWNDNVMIPQLVSLKSHNPNLKVCVSIGGWNFNANAKTKHLFHDMAATSVSRKRFIKSAIQFARKYNMDGIDIDWEYPGNELQGGHPTDFLNFNCLVKEFREFVEIDSKEENKEPLLITVAAPAGIQNIQNIDVETVSKYIDWFNLMTYDLHGAWDNITGPHTALYSTDGLSVNDCVSEYLKSGVPSHKLVLGLAHYARGWTVNNNTTEHKMGEEASGPSECGRCTGENGYLAKYEIDEIIPKNNIFFDDTSKTLFGYFDNKFYTFDDKETFKMKVEYAKEKSLGGVMMWSVDLDKDFVNTKYVRSVLASD
ncbi:chitotriosidase-1 precursor, putative [Entamoeba invadens IP1]|nr:chitotriosidase-1 precursor, putative [Entamoeba invadens IP1]ELP85315.1 chitotriosidase-1 precursor, putative [Entamoeba invadens IP1]|eukprot:XP_004184661.1 chitotriosidase-1 precursor, putative [Entamoeba invadens IP1]